MRIKNQWAITAYSLLTPIFRKSHIDWPAFENRGLWEAVMQIWDHKGDDFRAEWSADLAEYRERHGPYYSIYTPQQLLYVHIRDYGGGLIPGDLLQEEAA